MDFIRKKLGRKIAVAYLFLLVLLISFTGWFISFTLEKQAPADVGQMLALVRGATVVSVITGVIFVILFGFFLGRRVGRRVEEMTRAAERYARGDLSQKIELDAQDELKSLSDAMNDMADSLRDRIADMEAEKSQLNAILENMAEGIIAVDSESRVLLINSGAEKIIGKKQSQVLGVPLLEVTKNPDIDELMNQVICVPKVVHREIELYRPDEKTIKVSALGLEKCEGGVCGILVLYDVTEIKRLENLRRDFVANVSHELRTPLTSIKGFLETLISGALKDPDRARDFLGRMDEDASRLTRLINDLLDLSRIESGQLKMKIEPVDLAEQIEETLATFHPRLEEKKIFVVNLISSAKLPHVLADPDKLKQVLVNLVDNAIKFNRPAGQIKFSAETMNDRVKVSIEDSGSGIPNDDLLRIFERFYRVDKARAREEGGTGLGLAIVKHIIEAHGGEVFCESVIGMGTKFSFTLQTRV